VYIVEMMTTDGKICEPFATYEEAKRRVEQVPAAQLLGMPLIFKELPDGSQRLVREDGKPLQWHRLPEDRPEPESDAALPLSDEPPPPGGVQHFVKTDADDLELIDPDNLESSADDRT
jgi:hypothetical protein